MDFLRGRSAVPLNWRAVRHASPKLKLGPLEISAITVKRINTVSQTDVTYQLCTDILACRVLSNQSIAKGAAAEPLNVIR